MQQIHPTAIVEEGAQIGEGVVVEPYAVIKRNVVLGEGVVVKAHAYIDGHTSIGEGTTIYPGACIGTKTQDLKFRGEQTFVRIGCHCEIREFVTINSSCQEGSTVEVGDHCLIMAYCHIAHNCHVGNHVIMSNNATLAGHVLVEECAVIGGFTPIHQFCRVGRYAMIGGMSRVVQDMPPYLIGGGIPFRLGGVNRVGLKRHGFNATTCQQLHEAFRLLYRSGLTRDKAIDLIEELAKSSDESSPDSPRPELLEFVRFCRDSKRGLMSDVKSEVTADLEGSGRGVLN